MTSNILSPENVEKFIFGGNATFTLRSRKTEKHIAFKVKASKDRSCFFVRAHAGGTNGEGGFNYAGWMKLGYSKVFVSKKSHNDLDQARLALSWTLTQLKKGNVPQDLEVWHEGKCCRCGRKLTDPKSIELGIGPECIKKKT